MNAYLRKSLLVSFIASALNWWTVSGESITTFAETLDENVVVITADRHHIGDGNYGRDSNCASEFKLVNLGPTYSERFVVFDENLTEATLEISEICGLEQGRGGVRVSINFVEIGVVGNGTARLEVPVDLLNLGGKDNILRVDSQNDGGDVDDLEFGGVKLIYGWEVGAEAIDQDRVILCGYPPDSFENLFKTSYPTVIGSGPTTTLSLPSGKEVVAEREIIEYPDGSVLVIETDNLGNRVETATDAEGQVTVLETNADGSTVATVRSTDGHVSVVERFPSGASVETERYTNGTFEAVTKDKDGKVVETVVRLEDGSEVRVDLAGNQTVVQPDEYDTTSVSIRSADGNSSELVLDKFGEVLARAESPENSKEPGQVYFETVLKGRNWNDVPVWMKRNFANAEMKLRNQSPSGDAVLDAYANEEIEDDPNDTFIQELDAELEEIEQQKKDREIARAKLEAKRQREQEIQDSYDKTERLNKAYAAAVDRGDYYDARRIQGLQERHARDTMDLLRYTEEEWDQMEKKQKLRDDLFDEIIADAKREAESMVEHDWSQGMKEDITAGTSYVSIGSEMQQQTAHSTRRANYALAFSEAKRKRIEDKLREPGLSADERDILQDMLDLNDVQEAAASEQLSSNSKLTAAGYAIDVGMLATGGTAKLVNIGVSGGKAVLSKTIGRKAAENVSRLGQKVVDRAMTVGNKSVGELAKKGSLSTIKRVAGEEAAERVALKSAAAKEALVATGTKLAETGRTTAAKIIGEKGLERAGNLAATTGRVLSRNVKTGSQAESKLLKTMATDTAAGAVTDAGFQIAQTGTVDLEELARGATAGGIVGGGISHASDAIASPRTAASPSPPVSRSAPRSPQPAAQPNRPAVRLEPPPARATGAPSEPTTTRPPEPASPPVSLTVPPGSRSSGNTRSPNTRTQTPANSRAGQAPQIDSTPDYSGQTTVVESTNSGGQTTVIETPGQRTPIEWIDDSPDLPVIDIEPPVGSRSRHLTDDQIRELHQPGRNLTRDELVTKADLYRDLIQRRKKLGAAIEEGAPQAEIDRLTQDFWEQHTRMDRIRNPLDSGSTRRFDPNAVSQSSGGTRIIPNSDSPVGQTTRVETPGESFDGQSTRIESTPSATVETGGDVDFGATRIEVPAGFTPAERQAWADARAVQAIENMSPEDFVDVGEDMLPSIQEPEVGAYSKDLTAEEIRALHETGRDLSREELVAKADLHRDLHQRAWLLREAELADAPQAEIDELLESYNEQYHRIFGDQPTERWGPVPFVNPAVVNPPTVDPLADTQAYSSSESTQEAVTSDTPSKLFAEEVREGIERGVPQEKTQFLETDSANPADTVVPRPDFYDAFNKPMPGDPAGRSVREVALSGDPSSSSEVRSALARLLGDSDVPSWPEMAKTIDAQDPEIAKQLFEMRDWIWKELQGKYGDGVKATGSVGKFSNDLDFSNLADRPGQQILEIEEYLANEIELAPGVRGFGPDWRNKLHMDTFLDPELIHIYDRLGDAAARRRVMNDPDLFVKADLISLEQAHQNMPPAPFENLLRVVLPEHPELNHKNFQSFLNDNLGPLPPQNSTQRARMREDLLLDLDNAFEAFNRTNSADAAREIVDIQMRLNRITPDAYPSPGGVKETLTKKEGLFDIPPGTSLELPSGRSVESYNEGKPPVKAVELRKLAKKMEEAGMTADAEYLRTRFGELQATYPHRPGPVERYQSIMNNIAYFEHQLHAADWDPLIAMQRYQSSKYESRVLGDLDKVQEINNQGMVADIDEMVNRFYQERGPEIQKYFGLEGQTMSSKDRVRLWLEAQEFVETWRAANATLARKARKEAIGEVIPGSDFLRLTEPVPPIPPRFSPPPVPPE